MVRARLHRRPDRRLVLRAPPRHGRPPVGRGQAPASRRHRRPRRLGRRSASCWAAGSATCCSTICRCIIADPMEILAIRQRRHVVPRRLPRRDPGLPAVRPGQKLNGYTLLDIGAVVVPIGLFFGRIANFVNGELWGRPAPDFPYAIVFPSGGPAAAPSEPALRGGAEGLLLFIVHGDRGPPVRLPQAGAARRHLRRSATRSPGSSASSSASRIASSASCSATSRAHGRRRHHGHAALRADDRSSALALHRAGRAGRTRPRHPVATPASRRRARRPSRRDAARRRDRGADPADGPIGVDRYMALCLGHPVHGYYRTRDPLGARGDFTTAPEISQMFGELIGAWAAYVHGADGPAGSAASWWSSGPGRGTLMADALRALRAAAPACCASSTAPRRDQPGAAGRAGARARRAPARRPGTTGSRPCRRVPRSSWPTNSSTACRCASSRAADRLARAAGRPRTRRAASPSACRRSRRRASTRTARTARC